MTNSIKNVKVVMNANGTIEVIGLNKNGSESKVQYAVTETVGVKEFAKDMMAKGAAKQYDALKAAATPKQEEEKAPKSEPKQKTAPNKKGFVSIPTLGKKFTNMKGFKHEDIFHAVQFDIEGKGKCVVGFAKDRNQFMEYIDGVAKEVSRTDVLKRLAKYEGKDAAKLTKMVKGLKPVTMAAAKCSGCGCDVNGRVKDYSMKHYNVVLCRDCQTDFGKSVKGENTAPSASEAQNELASEKKGPSASEAVADAVAEVTASEVCKCGGKKKANSVQCRKCINAEHDKRAEEEVKRAMAWLDEEVTEGEPAGEPEAEFNQMDLFDAGELTVNAGVKGIEGTDSTPVE